MMSKAFLQLVAEFRRLGCTVVCAEFDRIIIATHKTTLPAAQSFLGYLVEAVRSKPLFTHITLEPVKFWQHLLFMDHANYAGVLLAQEAHEVGEFDHYGGTQPVGEGEESEGDGDDAANAASGSESDVSGMASVNSGSVSSERSDSDAPSSIASSDEDDVEDDDDDGELGVDVESVAGKSAATATVAGGGEDEEHGEATLESDAEDAPGVTASEGAKAEADDAESRVGSHTEGSPAKSVASGGAGAGAGAELADAEAAGAEAEAPKHGAYDLDLSDDDGSDADMSEEEEEEGTPLGEDEPGIDAALAKREAREAKRKRRRQERRRRKASQRAARLRRKQALEQPLEVNSSWNIAEFLPPEVAQLFNIVVAEFLVKPAEFRQQLLLEAAGETAGALTSTQATASQAVPSSAAPGALTEDVAEQEERYVKDLVATRLTRRMLEWLPRVRMEIVGASVFPVRPGSHLRMESAALELTKMVCHVLALDSKVHNEVSVCVDVRCGRVRCGRWYPASELAC